MNQETKYRRHPVSEAWGDQSESEYAELRTSMETRRFDPNEAILALPDGSIIDGWHRYLAAADVGVEPVIKVIELEPAEIYAITRSKHLARRNKSARERAAADIRAKRACGYEFAPSTGGRPSKDATKEKQITATNVAEAASVSTATAHRAIREERQDEDPFGLPAEEKAKAKKKAKAKAKAKPQAETAPPENTEEKGKEREELIEQVSRLEHALTEEQSHREQLEEKLAIVSDSLPDGAENTLQQRDNVIATLKLRVDAMAAELAQAKRDLRSCRGIKTKLEKRIKELEGAE